MRNQRDRFRRTFFALWCLLVCGAPQAFGAFTFNYQVPNNLSTAVAPGGTISFPTVPVGQSLSVTLTISNTDSAAWTVSSATTTGGNFRISGLGTVIPPNGSASLAITMTPDSSTPVVGTLHLRLSGPNGQAALANFSLSGLAGDGILTSYIVPPSSNETPVVAGGLISFPPTPLGASATATFIVSNLTDADVVLNAIAFSGEAFQVTSVPLFPRPLASKASLNIVITFRPTANLTYSGVLTLTIAGAARSFSLQAQGTSPILTYQVISSGTTSNLAPGATLPFPSAAANSGENHQTITVRNTGNSTTQINSIFVDKVDFRVDDLPSLPATLPAGGGITFSLTFAPKNVGNLTATLSIGGASFPLTGTGIGKNLTYAVVLGGQTTAITPGATLTLPNTPVGAKLPFSVQISNSGNQDASIGLIQVVGQGLSAVTTPAVPASLPMGGTLQVDAIFQPSSVGIINGYLQLDGQTLAIRAVGDAPPPLPDVIFGNISETVLPVQQPSVQLHLAKAYPYDLTGFLTLTFAPGTPGDDPAIQFINGLRYVTFRIPANSTDNAILTNIGSTAATGAVFQTGSTAGVIRLAATFSLGSYDMTASGPVTKSVTIAPDSPTIRGLQLMSQSNDTLTLIMTGYSTPRSIDRISFQFAPVVGSVLQTTTLDADVKSAFAAWFASTVGNSFGSQFSMTIQLKVNGSIGAIKAVSATASNSLGASSAATITLR